MAAAAEAAVKAGRSSPTTGWSEESNGFIWAGQEPVDLQTCADAFDKLLELPSFRRGLDALKEKKLMGWLNVRYPRRHPKAKVRAEYEALRAHLGEYTEALRKVALDTLGTCKSGYLTEKKWDLVSYGFMLSPPGSKPQPLHMDYSPNEIVILANIGADVSPKSGTQYFTTDEGEKLRDSLRQIKTIDYYDLSLEDVMDGVDVSLKSHRAPVTTGRPYVVLPMTLHRGMGAPDDAPFRIAFYANFVDHETGVVEMDDRDIEAPMNDWTEHHILFDIDTDEPDDEVADPSRIPVTYDPSAAAGVTPPTS